MFLRTLRRGGAATLGVLLGLGFAHVLCFPHAFTGKPRCPRCGGRADVESVTYRPLGDGKFQAVAGSRYIAPYEADRVGPRWVCLRCTTHIGSRLPGEPAAGKE